MTAIWTWLRAWWRRRAAAGGWAAAPSDLGLPPHVLARSRALVDRLDVTFTQQTVAQIQAELRAAAAEDRLADYTAAWLQGSVEELSADLLRERRAQRDVAGPAPGG